MAGTESSPPISETIHKTLRRTEVGWSSANSSTSCYGRRLLLLIGAGPSDVPDDRPHGSRGCASDFQVTFRRNFRERFQCGRAKLGGTYPRDATRIGIATAEVGEQFLEAGGIGSLGSGHSNGAGRGGDGGERKVQIVSRHRQVPRSVIVWSWR